MSNFIDVRVGEEIFTVDYKATALVSYPVHIAAAAIEQQEIIWLRENMTASVMNQLTSVFVYAFGPNHSIEDHLSDLRLVDDYPETTFISGQYVWQFELMCDECEGCGTTLTRRGREIDCPCCSGCGATFRFSIFTNQDGIFTGFPPRPVWKPSGVNFHDYSFEPRPLDEALEVIGGAA